MIKKTEFYDSDIWSVSPWLPSSQHSSQPKKSLPTPLSGAVAADLWGWLTPLPVDRYCIGVPPIQWRPSCTELRWVLHRRAQVGVCVGWYFFFTPWGNFFIVIIFMTCYSYSLLFLLNNFPSSFLILMPSGELPSSSSCWTTRAASSLRRARGDLDPRCPSRSTWLPSPTCLKDITPVGVE